MFCLWKNSPFAPCACAYRLQGSPGEILNHLGTMGPATMVIKQEGLSMVRTTPFGQSAVEKRDGWDILVDRISGLEIAGGQLPKVHLLTDATDPRPLLAIGEPGTPVDLSIRLDGHHWHSPAVRKMIRLFDGAGLDCADSRRLGAGAWLDEWGEAPPSTCDQILVREAKRILNECQVLEVEVKTQGQRNTARFTPSFIDVDGRVLRIADRNCRHVVFADAESPDFHLARLSPALVQIARDLPACA